MTGPGVLPNFFIIGAAKAGTTSLYDLLDQHPQVYFPFVKEPAFFCDDEYFANGVDWYVNTYFAKSRSQPARGDATSTYLYWGGKVAPRLRDLYGADRPRLIVIFRDPVKLVHSFYWHSVREGREALGIREALAAEESRLAEHRSFLMQRGRIQYAYSRIGLYAEQLRVYLDHFPRDRFLFLLTEDLRDFPSLQTRLEEFLGLDHREGLRPARSNPAALPRSRRLHRWLRNTSAFKEVFKTILPFPIRHRLKMAAIDINLQPFNYPPLDEDIAWTLRRRYADDTRRLEDMIGRDLSAWYSGV